MKLSPIHYAITDALYQMDSPLCYDLDADQCDLIFFILMFQYFMAEELGLV